MSKRALPFLAAVLTACPPPPLDSGNQTGPPAEVRLLFPETNPDVAYCPDITAYAAVDEFTLSDDIGGNPVPGEGHWHLIRAVGCEEAVLGETSGSYIELTGGAALAPGNHTLWAELVGNDHQPLDPPVRFEASIRVEDSEDCVGGAGG
ncbi:MAG: hypothetical protein KC912_13095 [Proteobacteria bacterium]|nr:hypothetical protein [Pseudomonadota bacterium]